MSCLTAVQVARTFSHPLPYYLPEGGLWLTLPDVEEGSLLELSSCSPSSSVDTDLVIYHGACEALEEVILASRIPISAVHPSWSPRPPPLRAAG